MKLYTLIWTLLIMWLMLIGYALPFLFSANDDMLAASGVAVIFISLPLSFVLLSKIIKDPKVQLIIKKLGEYL